MIVPVPPWNLKIKGCSVEALMQLYLAREVFLRLINHLPG